MKKKQKDTNNTKPLTSEEIAETMVNAGEGYKENVVEILTAYFEKNEDSKISWDAWFRGANDKDMELADKGVEYSPKNVKSSIMPHRKNIIVEFQKLKEGEKSRKN